VDCRGDGVAVDRKRTWRETVVPLGPELIGTECSAIGIEHSRTSTVRHNRAIGTIQHEKKLKTYIFPLQTREKLETFRVSREPTRRKEQRGFPDAHRYPSGFNTAAAIRGSSGRIWAAPNYDPLSRQAEQIPETHSGGRIFALDC
jgi:hypothetical protein